MNITADNYLVEESDTRFIKGYFREGPNGPLAFFPTKEKRRLAILRRLITRFDTERTYTEKEVNGILAETFHDYAILRRNLVEYGFLDRYADGSCYWVKY
ncbi:DUF2087 domain-containing protein [Geotalea toluenoxydans]|uniref:DUF2087 domain-containing protein n=1 Tax=Geotalea toluenoxydans TaxID=421624 RepID=UPI000B1B013C|nr:DUF2087 domain-containing protein [Geotalea toluenoxydans]